MPQIPGLLLLLWCSSSFALSVGPYADSKPADFDHIDETLQESIKISSSDPEGYLSLAWSALAQNNFAQVSHILRAAKQHGASPELWMPIQGHQWLIQNKPNEILSQLIVEQDDVASSEWAQNVLLIRANAYLLKGEIKEALNIANELTSVNPYYAEACLMGARLYALSLEFDAAETALKEAERLGIRTTDRAFVQGDIYRLQGDTHAAIASYERALRANPNNLWATLHLTSLLLETEREADFYRYSKQLIQHLPNHDQVRLFYAITLTQKGSLAEAEKLLLTHKGNAVSKLLLARILYSQQRYQQAEKGAQEVLSEAPDNIQARTLLAAIALKNIQPKKAIALLEPFVSDITEDTRLVLMLGTAYVLDKQRDQGLQWLSKAEQLKQEQQPEEVYVAAAPLAQPAFQALPLPEAVLNNNVLGVLSAIDRKAWQTAERRILAHSKDEGDDVLTHYLWGRLKEGQGDRTGAMLNYQSAINLDSKFLAARQQLAQIHLDNGEYQAANELTQVLLRKNPKDMIGLLLSANIAERSGRIGSAIEYLKKAQQAHPKRLEPGHALVLFYLRQEQQSRAYHLARDLTRIFTHETALHRLYGELALERGDSTEAILVFKGLAEATPHVPSVHLGLAKAYRQYGRLNAAKEVLVTLLKDNPHYYPALVFKAEIAMEQEGYDEVMRLAKLLAQEYPERSAGYRFLGDVYQVTLQTRKAEAAYARAWALEPSGVLAESLYTVRVALNAHLKAFESLETWLMNNPEDVKRQRFLAGAYMAYGANTKAVDRYESILAIKNSDIISLNNLALLKIDSDLESALALAESAYQKAPNQPQVMDTYGWIKHREGQSEDAQRLLEKAYALAPTDKMIKQHLSAVYLALGKAEAAHAIAQ